MALPSPSPSPPPQLTASAPPPLGNSMPCRRSKLTGVQKRGEQSTPLTGVRAPLLKRSGPNPGALPKPCSTAKTSPVGSHIGNVANTHWTVQDGLPSSTATTAPSLKMPRKFDDFKVHYEVNCPDGGNGGFYLRGRYEVQIEYEPLTSNPLEAPHRLRLWPHHAHARIAAHSRPMGNLRCHLSRPSHRHRGPQRNLHR